MAEGYINISNRVDKATLRAVQSKTMDDLKEILAQSFGPMGSTTIIRKQGTFNRYTKDGHTILSNIHFKGEIEESVREDIEALTRHTVLGLGDSSTSIVLLAAILFKKLAKIERESKLPPSDLITHFKSVIKTVCEIIENNGRDCTIDDIYNIALISTNNNEDLAKELKVVYENYGLDVFIDVTISNTEETILKSYDGLTLNAGYAENAFINNKNGTCSIRKPLIYVFEDPIDTPEMMGFLDLIIQNNILIHYSGQEGTSPENVVPTIIMAPRISRDMSAFMTQLIDWLGRVDTNELKPPINIITNIYDEDTYSDIARLCGAKPIKKYIDLKVQEADIKAGRAPTPQTINTFAGTADIVESDIAKTKFINPQLMLDKEGNYTSTFQSMIDFLEAELKKCIDEGGDITTKGKIKRRLNALKANMVEILVGGITVADRDSKRDLLEDAVLNCRSAAQNGVGYGANFEGYRAVHYLLKDVNGDFPDDAKIASYRNNYNDIDMSILVAIYDAYIELCRLLYATKYDKKKADAIVKESLTNDCPMNIRTGEYDKLVLSSIKADEVVLNTIAELLTLMITSNQFLLPTFLSNLYDNVDTADFKEE